jgi:hypothetical protein
MSEEEARALAAEVARTPGWMAEVFEGATGGRWYLVTGHESDPLTQFVMRDPRDWERLQDVLDDA